MIFYHVVRLNSSNIHLKGLSIGILESMSEAPFSMELPWGVYNFPEKTSAKGEDIEKAMLSAIAAFLNEEVAGCNTADEKTIFFLESERLEQSYKELCKAQTSKNGECGDELLIPGVEHPEEWKKCQLAFRENFHRYKPEVRSKSYMFDYAKDMIKEKYKKNPKRTVF